MWMIENSWIVFQRSRIEIIIVQFKAICQIEHTRHRKPDYFLINLLAGLAAYVVRPRKSPLKINSLPSFSTTLISN